MKIIEINTCNFGSTGHIMSGIAAEARKSGHQVYICYTSSRSFREKSENAIEIGNIISRNIHRQFAYFSGFSGLFSILSTLLFLMKLNRVRPDIIHLHNLHGNYINLPLLFGYIKRNNIPIVWTLHDCWAFTGQCSYYLVSCCDKWKKGCFDCHHIHEYPGTKVDRTRVMWELKKKWFNGIRNMTIVTPSLWLANQLQVSYLKGYPVTVINNGIDMNVFKPTQSCFRQKYSISQECFVLLGVAFGWSERKGIDVFIDLAQKLDERFMIVLVGTDDVIDRILPSRIISIHKTNNQNELAEVYSACDVFINPSGEESFGMVNIEALACGIPVITFDSGGTSETIDAECGLLIPRNNSSQLYDAIMYIYDNRPFSSADCVSRAFRFDASVLYRKYVDLYEGIQK